MKVLLIILIILVIFFVYRIARSPKRYRPTKAASGGLKPNGGMREASLRLQKAGLKYAPVHYNEYDPYIYDSHMIPDPVVFPVGHWSA